MLFVFFKNVLHFFLKKFGAVYHVVTFLSLCFWFVYTSSSTLWLKVPSLLCFLCMIFVLLHDLFVHNFLVQNRVPPKRLEGRSKLEILTKYRRSCRTFQHRRLTREDQHEITDFINQVLERSPYVGSGGVRIEYVPGEVYALLITGALEFLVGIIPKEYTNEDLMDVGNLLEKVVVKCTEMGIGTCWVGGFVGPLITDKIKSFQKDLDHVAVIIPLGYVGDYSPLIVRFSYFMLRRRKSFQKLFFKERFDTPLEISPAEEPFFEAVRWSPSSGNSQALRLIKQKTPEEEKYHFYKKSKSFYYSNLDIGIYMCHWKIACAEMGRKGRFVCEDPGLENVTPAIYCCTWIEE